MMKKIFFSLFVLVSFSNQNFASTIDSLIHLVEKINQKDTTAIKDLVSISKKMDEAHFILKIKILNKALEISNAINDEEWQRKINRKIGGLYYDHGEYNKALPYAFEAVKIAEKKNEQKYIVEHSILIGSCYEGSNDFANAKKYFSSVLKFCSENKLAENVGDVYSSLGVVYEKQHLTDSALTAYKKAKDYFKSTNNFYGMGSVLGNTGLLFKHLKKYDEAIKYLTQAKNVADTLKDPYVYSAYYNNMACINMDLGKYDEAKRNFDSSIHYANRVGNLELLNENFKNLAEMYEKKKDWNLAYVYFKKHFATNDSLFNLSKAAQVAEIQAIYETEKQEQEISQLTLKNKQETFARNLLIGGCLSLLIFAFLFYQRYRFKKQANEKLEKAFVDLKNTQAQLVQSEKLASVGLLTAGIAHEINNPINFIASNVPSMKRDLEDILQVLAEYSKIKTPETNVVEQLKKKLDLDYTIDEIKQLMEGMTEGSLRTAEIVRGLRNFARTNEEEMKKYDVESGLDSTLVLLRNLFQDSIEIEKHYAHIPQIDCFPGKLNQVFMNILTNAAQAIDGKGIINISTALNSDNEHVIISIKDSGSGMSKEVLHKIFEPFFTTKEIGKGTGLGLSISHGIILEHNGKISVNSESGIGTEFVIELPINHFA